MILIRPTIATQALLSGEIEFSTLFTRSTTAAVSGAPVRLVMALNTGPLHVLVVKPEIKTMKDLKGKIVGIDGPKQILEGYYSGIKNNMKNKNTIAGRLHRRQVQP